MAENGIKLMQGEGVIKQYDFITRATFKDRTYEAEDSLIITNKRLVRRVASANVLLQDEVLLDDVNQVGCNYHTANYVTQEDNKSKTKMMIIIAAILFVFAVVAFITLGVLPGVLGLVVAIVLVIVALVNRMYKNTRKDTTLKIVFTQRGTNNSFMKIEKVFEEDQVAIDIANEIGSVLLKAREGKTITDIYE